MRKFKIISVIALVSILSCVFAVSSFAAEPAPTPDAAQSLVDRINTALSDLVLGMLVVFSVMALLCVILGFTGKFFAAKDKKAEKKKEKDAESAPAPAPAVAVPDNNDDEIVAAITAAVALMLAEEGNANTSFRVVSFKKTNTKRSWNNN